MLVGAARAQAPSPWVGTATDATPPWARPPIMSSWVTATTEEDACTRQFRPLLEEVRKSRDEMIWASREHAAQSSAACRAYGRFFDVEGRLISFLQSKPMCQRLFFGLDKVRTNHAKAVLLKEYFCSPPERPYVRLHEVLTAEPPPRPSNPLRY
jgi:hypothetical protein